MKNKTVGPMMEIKKVEPLDEFIRVASPMDVEMIAESLTKETKEVFQLLYMNSQGEVMATQLFYPDPSDPSIMSFREIFKSALGLDAVSIIVCHTHGANRTSPSMLDRGISDNLAQAGKLIGVELLDSLFISGKSFTSIK